MTASSNSVSIIGTHALELDERTAIGSAHTGAPLQQLLAAVVLVDSQLDECEPVVRLGLLDRLDQLVLRVAADREDLALPVREGVAVEGLSRCGVV